jgi:hypothetical protein
MKLKPMNFRSSFQLPLFLAVGASVFCLPLPAAPSAKDTTKASGKSKNSTKRRGEARLDGTRKIWEDRGPLTPMKVYFGAASLRKNPLESLPAPPFSHFEPDDKDRMATSPKAKLRDAKGVKWTAKFGSEAHSDTVAPRLAWALGFGTVEGYYVGAGRIEGIDASTKLGREKRVILPDGTLRGGARFKRHDKSFDTIPDAKGNDLTWDEAKNPGVPPEQLSGLLIFDVMVNNWDAQPKNCKVYRYAGPNGPELWYISADLGASFASRPKNKFVLADYMKEPNFIKRVTEDTVEFNFTDVVPAQARIHQRVPLAHARWFRKQVSKLTDDEIQAAFDAAFATDGLNKAYASGNASAIKAAREKELSADTRAEIAGFAAKFRAKIDELKSKVPEG